jgi:hypothetical protein
MQWRMEMKLLHSRAMQPSALRRAKEEFARAIANQQEIGEKAAAYLSALRRYRLAVCNQIAGCSYRGLHIVSRSPRPAAPETPGRAAFQVVSGNSRRALYQARKTR